MRKDWIACLIYCAIMVTPVIGYYAIYAVLILASPLTYFVAMPLAQMAHNETSWPIILVALLALVGPLRAVAFVAWRTPREKRLGRILETVAIWTLISGATYVAFAAGQLIG